MLGLLLAGCNGKTERDSSGDTGGPLTVGELCFVEHFVATCPTAPQAEDKYQGAIACTKENGSVEIRSVTSPTKEVDTGKDVWICCYDASFVVLGETCDTGE